MFIGNVTGLRDAAQYEGTANEGALTHDRLVGSNVVNPPISPEPSALAWGSLVSI
jgi:hypothetical protein